MTDVLMEAPTSPITPLSPCSSEEVTTAATELVSSFKQIEDINAGIRNMVRSGSSSGLKPEPVVEEQEPVNFEPIVLPTKDVSPEFREWLSTIKLDYLVNTLAESGYDNLDFMVKQMKSG
jgi:adenine deaminase